MYRSPRPADCPQRRAAVPRAALLDTFAEEGCDRLTRMAARLLGTPVAFISLVTDDRQFFKSARGLPEPWASGRATPIAYSFCRHVVDARAPLIVEDTRRHPLLRVSPAVRELGWIAYAGVPLITPQGHVVGTLGVVDARPRLWSEREIALLHDLAASAVTEIELRSLRAERKRAELLSSGQSRLLEEIASGAPLAGVLSQVMEALPIGVWVASADGRIILGNPAGQEIWGGAKHTDLGHFGDSGAWWADSGEPVLPEQWPAARALRGGETSINELVRIRSRDGRDKIILSSAIPIRGDADDIVGAVLLNQDVTDRQAAEDALRQSQGQLRQAQKMEAVGRLAGGIAHDFNNLLTGVLTHCDLILQEVRQSDPLRSDVEQIRDAGQRAAGLTRQLLAFSRRQLLQPRVLSLNATVTELDGMLRQFVRADIVLETRLDPELWSVFADPGQIEQALVNLVVNARDAMPGGGRITVSTANRPQSGPRRPGDYVALSVADTGHGMDLETQARIFDPFFTTREQGNGTGLGLSTAYGIVEQSGGYITVESAPGRGATFTIHLPRHAGENSVSPSQRHRRALAGGAETLLLVEDETAVRTASRRLLERHGYTVLEARHGADALRILAEAHREVDLVLTDLVMPEMGGRDLVERLRASRPQLKVLFMTGYTEQAIAPEGVLPPRTGLVEKPFTIEQLLQGVREVLDEESG